MRRCMYVKQVWIASKLYRSHLDYSMLACNSVGTFIPLRVTEDTPVYGRSGFVGYLRWMLHSPGVTATPVRSSVREEGDRGIVASYW